MSRMRPVAVLLAAMLAFWSPAAAGASGDPLRPLQWGLDVIGAPAAWPAATGAGITIAVVDSGVDLSHEDLAANIAPGRNFVEPGGEPQDDHGHGSHVAGIAAAVTGNGRGIAGVAPQAKIMPVRVISRNCEGEDCSASGSLGDIVAGIRWAADNGAHVVNLSLADNVVSRNVLSSSLSDAVEYAWERGAIPVVAAGNDAFGSGYGNLPALVVVATDRDDRLARYSNTSGSLLRDARWGIAAPGGAGDSSEGDIMSAWWIKGKASQYAYAAGTSMAAPHVSGAAAVLRSLGLSQQQTVDRLLSTARDLGPPGRDSTYGHGRIDLAAAVEGLGAPSTEGQTPESRPAPEAAAPAHPPAPEVSTPRSTPRTDTEAVSPTHEEAGTPTAEPPPVSPEQPMPERSDPPLAAPPPVSPDGQARVRALIGAGGLVLLGAGALVVRRLTG